MQNAQLLFYWNFYEKYNQLAKYILSLKKYLSLFISYIDFIFIFIKKGFHKFNIIKKVKLI